MFEQLEDVSWSELKHAYGPASDVPEQIRRLADPDLRVRDAALSDLYSNVFHQGTRWQATPYAIPFLYEIVDSEMCAGRHEVVHLLVKLALGYEESYLPGGVDVSAFRRDMDQADREMSALDREKCAKFGFGPRIDLDCYDAVRRGVSTLVKLLDVDEPALRRAASYALAWFPEEAWQSLPEIQNLLQSESDDFNIANAIPSIGLLTRSSAEIVDPGLLSDFLQHGSLLVRASAAIAMASSPLQARIIEILIDAISSPDELQGLEENIHFNEGNIAGYGSRVLAKYGIAERARIIPALSDLLKSVKPYPSLDVCSSMLGLLVAGKSQPIKDSSPDLLDQTEYDALRVLAQSSGWGIERSQFVNFVDIVRSYGLPDSRQALTEYLDGRTV